MNSKYYSVKMNVELRENEKWEWKIGCKEVRKFERLDLRQLPIVIYFLFKADL